MSPIFIDPPICIANIDDAIKRASPVEIADINEAIINAGYDGIKLVSLIGSMEIHSYDLGTVEGHVMKQIIASVQAGVMKPPAPDVVLAKIAQFYEENKMKGVSDD